MSKFMDLATQLASRFGGHFGLTGYKVSLDGDQLEDPKDSSENQAATEARLAVWRARVEPGLEQKPLEEWPQARVGERVALLAQSIAESFEDSFSAMTRASVCLMHRLHDSGCERIEISALASNLSQSSPSSAHGLALSLRGVSSAQLAQIEAQTAIQDATDRQPHASVSTPGARLRFESAPEGEILKPAEKLAPVWSDPLFCASVAEQMRIALKIEWSESLGAAAYALTIFEHMAHSGSSTLTQTARGLVTSTEKTNEEAAAMSRACFELVAGLEAKPDLALAQAQTPPSPRPGVRPR